MGAGVSVIHPTPRSGVAEDSNEAKAKSEPVSTFVHTALQILDFLVMESQYPEDRRIVAVRAKEYYYEQIMSFIRNAHVQSQQRPPIPIMYCGFLEFEECIEKMFSNGITPILLDTSPDDKACTYYSYQPDYVLFEAKTMVMEYSRRLPLMQCLEMGRKYVVNAMKFGKTLIVRLGNSAPDFMNIFNDDVLSKTMGGVDVRAKQGGYLPLELFTAGGALMRDEVWPYILFREEDMKPHKNFAYCR
jgi:hypothetical protein